MKCPICNDTNLVMSERQGVEIDYCPQCRGVWLDRGELDKIIERSASPAPQTQAPAANYPGGHGHAHGHGYMDKDHGHHHKKRKPGGFLGELFDF